MDGSSWMGFASAATGTAEGTLLCGEGLRPEAAALEMLFGFVAETVDPWASARDGSGGAAER